MTWKDNDIIEVCPYTAQYRYYAAVVLPLQFLSNLLIGQRLSQDDSHHNVLNAALSLVAPAAYNAPDGQHGMQYFEWTCITFAVNLASTALLLNTSSFFGLVAIHRIPLSASAVLGLDIVDAKVMGWGVFSVIMLTASVNLVSGMGVTRCLWDICGKLQEPFNKDVVEPVTKAINNIHGFKAMFCFAPFGSDSTSCEETDIKTEYCDNDACPCKDIDKWDDLGGYEEEEDIEQEDNLLKGTDDIICCLPGRRGVRARRGCSAEA